MSAICKKSYEKCCIPWVIVSISMTIINPAIFLFCIGKLMFKQVTYPIHGQVSDTVILIGSGTKLLCYSTCMPYMCRLITAHAANHLGVLD